MVEIETLVFSPNRWEGYPLHPVVCNYRKKRAGVAGPHVPGAFRPISLFRPATDDQLGRQPFAPGGGRPSGDVSGTDAAVQPQEEGQE